MINSAVTISPRITATVCFFSSHSLCGICHNPSPPRLYRTYFPNVYSVLLYDTTPCSKMEEFFRTFVLLINSKRRLPRCLVKCCFLHDSLLYFLLYLFLHKLCKYRCSYNCKQTCNRNSKAAHGTFYLAKFHCLCSTNGM